jgi:hypothetical protein
MIEWLDWFEAMAAYLPGPVMFGLDHPRFSVVSVRVGPLSVGTIELCGAI